MFEILEHTADIGFRTWGATPAKLFENAAMALQSIAVEMEAADEVIPYPIAATGEDYESLMVNWLNEVLYYLDGERVVMGRVEVDRIAPDQVKALGWGEMRDSERHPPNVIVKGVTYHQLSVKQEEGRWSARVFLDI